VAQGAESHPRDRIGRLLAPRAAPDSTDQSWARELETAFRREPTPQLREQLAATYMRSGAPERALAILAPSWGKDLTAVEVRIVLEADRRRDDARRALALARAVDPDRPEPADRDLWALVAMMCVGNGHAPEGLRALDSALTLDPGNSGLRMYRATLAARARE
jgi:hypothetical protein